MRRMFAVLLMALACSACGDDTGDSSDDRSPTTSAAGGPTADASVSGTASPTTTAVPTTSSEPSTGGLALAPFGQDASFISFASPTGNLTCVLYGESAECRAQEHIWQASPEPPECSEVGADLGGDPGDWGRLSVSGAPDGEASFFCGTDPIDPEDNVLEYGQYVRVGSIQCESQSNGLTCRNTSSTHGFTLSRETVSLF